MAPYIEDPEVWSDFHGRLAAEISSHLNKQIQPRYVARMTPRTTYDIVTISETGGIYPDVAVWSKKPNEMREATAPFAVPTAPIQSQVELELPLEIYSVEIREAGEMRLVTAIGIVSPVNKRPGHEAFDEYLKNRRDLLRSAAHLIEIDLLRGGKRPPLARPVPPAPYYVMLSRVSNRPRVDVRPIQLHEQLPKLPVPLLEPDEDAQLDLGQVIRQVYENGGYATIIDYKQAPPPRLSESESRFVDSLLKPLRENVQPISTN
jgi:hypothetical protein